MKKKIFGLCISLTFCSVASATKYYVNDASTTGDVYCTAVGSAGNNGLSPSAPRLTLTSVLSTYAASFAAGDTIFVDAGTYSEIQLSSPLNGVVIKGAGIMKTLISPSGSDRFFMLINDNNTVLSDMKLSGYDNQTTSGVQALGIANGTTGVKILNVQVDGCKTTSTGGGYPIEIGSGVSVVFNGGGATCNTWDAGGGMHVAGSTSTVTIRNFQFIGNYQLSANGTALSVAGGTVNVLNTRFEYNTIGGDKSGVGIDMQGGALNIYDSYFYNNKTNILSNNIGGALSVHAGTCHVVRSVFSTNVPQSATSGIYGAAIGETGGSLLVDSCRFTANSGARANDIYVSGGNALTRNCTFGSAANQIGIAGSGTFSISLCGTPSEYGAGIVHVNTTAPSYTANPALPDYLQVSCVAIPCTTPTITSTAPTGTICSGGTFSTTLAATTNSAQTTYSWTSAAVAGISGHATSGAGNINEALVNGTGSPLTVTYSVTPYFNTSCAGPLVVYTVTVYPVATIIANGSTLCSSLTATITPSGATSYTLNPGGLTGTSFTVAPSTNTTYTVSGNSASVCPATQAVLTITVLTTPTVALAASQATICSGNAVVLTPSGASTYTLNPGALSGASFTLNPTATTTYTLSGTGSTGCVSANTATSTVVVNTTPTVALAANATTLCSGNPLVLTPSGAATYTLNPGNLSAGSYTLTPLSSTVYTLSGTSISGCVAANTVTLGVTINTTPTVALAASQPTICSGNAVMLTPSGASTYTLNPGALSGSSFTLNPTATTTYTLSGTGSTGCVSANTATSTVVVNTTPTVALGANATTLCSGNPLILTPSGASTYTLNPGNLSAGSYTLTPLSSTVYTLSGTSASGCVAANTITLGVTVNTTPTLTLSVSSPSLCSGNSVVLTPSGASGYTLNPGNLSAVSFTLSPLASTQYTLTGQSSAGCPASNTPTTNITVYNTPTITPASAGSQTLCSGTTITLTASGATTYTWNPGGLTGNSVSDNPTSSNVYTVTGMNTPGNCVNTATIAMTVNATPTVNIPTNTLDLCSGNPLVLPAATGGTVISWTGPNSFTSAVASPTVTNAIATTDAGIYAVSLSQSYPGITCYSAAQQVTVSVVSSAVIAVANASVCIGSSVVITPSGGTSYTLAPGGAAGQSFTLNPLSTSVYTVNGSAGTGCNGSASFTLQVNPLPTVTAVPAATQVCSGFGTSLTASGTDLYSWDANAGNAASASVSVTPLSSTVYTVVGTNTLTGCSSTATVTVNVATTPTVSAVSNLAAVCAGQSATLTLSGATSYTIANPVQVVTSTIQVTPSAPTTYTILGLDGSCYSQPVTLFVDYNALPVLTVGDQTICAQSTATLTASGADTYTWMPGTQYNATVSVTPASTTVYTVAGTSSLTGCTSLETPVTVYVNPLPTLTVTANPGMVCASGTVNLGVVASAAGSTYTWSPGNGIIGTNQNQPLVSFPATGLTTGVYVYTVEATSPLGCVSAPATVSLQVVALPNSSFSLSPLSLCQNATGVLSIDSPQPGVNYNWTLGGIPVSNTTSVSIPSSLAGVSGQYTVSVIAAIGSCTNVSVSTLTVHALPHVTVSPDQVSECAGTTVVFTADASDPSLSFVWIYNGQTLGNGTSWTVSSISSSQAGLYVVTVSDANGCKASAQVSLELKDCEVFIPEIFTPNGDGKNDVFEIKHIEDYPNNHLKIFNRWGNLIYEKPGYNNEFDGHANVKDAVGSDKLPVGTYYVILEFNDGKTKAYSGYVQLQY